MENPICKQCAHFHQHYVVDTQRCAAVNCGHCFYPRPKKRTPITPACTYFTPREMPPSLPDRQEVINFLTKDLLQHILELELPPEVTEDEGFD